MLPVDHVAQAAQDYPIVMLALALFCPDEIRTAVRYAAELRGGT